jgi:hypothetical protein
LEELEKIETIIAELSSPPRMKLLPAIGPKGEREDPEIATGA